MCLFLIDDKKKAIDIIEGIKTNYPLAPAEDEALNLAILNIKTLHKGDWQPISEPAIDAIKSYCAKRNYKCVGCRYSVKWINKEYSGKSCTCIFGNCPCSWDVGKENS